MLAVLIIGACLIFSIILAFLDRNGNKGASLATTATVYCLIFAIVSHVHGTGWLCALASLAWTVNLLVRSDVQR